MTWLRRSLLLARTETIRSLRKNASEPWRGLAQALLVTFTVAIAVGRLPIPGYRQVNAAPGAYVVGRRLAAGEAVGPSVRGAFALGVVLLTLMYGLRTAVRPGWREHEAGVLTAVPVRVAVVGEYLAKVAHATVSFGPALVVGSVALTAGSGSAAAGGTMLVAGALAVLTAVALGYLAGLGVLVLFRQSAFAREHRTLVGAPLAAGYFALFVNVRTTLSVLGGLPAGWYGDLAVAGVAPGPGAVPVLVASPLVAGTALAAAVPAAEGAWLADPPSGGATTAEEVESAESDAGATLLAPLSRPTRAVVRAVWTRLRREPRALLYVAFPLALLLSVVPELAGRIPHGPPLLVALYGSWAVGSGATMNLLGNEGVALPAGLTAPNGPRTLVRGYVLAALIPGVPAIAACSALVALVAGSPPVVVVGVALLGAGLAVGAAGVSTAVGTLLPEFDGLSVTSGSGGLRPPSVYAISLYSAAMGLLGAPAIVGLLAGGSGLVLGPLATVVCSLVATVAGYRFTVGRVRGFDVAG